MVGNDAVRCLVACYRLRVSTSTSKLPLARGGDPSTLRRINSEEALRRFRRGPATIAELATTIGVSRTAAQQIVNDLAERRWVEQEISSASTAPRLGPAPRHYRLRANAGYVAGADIGRHYVRTMLCDLSGTIVARAETVVTAEATREIRLDALRRGIDDCLDEAKVKRSKLWLISLGTRGVVNDGRVEYVGGIPGWENLDLSGAVATEFGCEVTVENDSNLAAVAEQWIGVGQQINNLLCIEVGKSIGVGLVINGQLHRGFAGYAGELHHLPFLNWRGAAAYLKGDESENVDQKVIFDAARSGDATATAAVEKYASALSKGIAMICAVIDPELIVLGGGVSASGEILRVAVESNLHELTARAPRMALSTLGSDAVPLGAIRLGLDSVEKRIVDAGNRLGYLPSPQRKSIFST